MTCDDLQAGRQTVATDARRNGKGGAAPQHVEGMAGVPAIVRVDLLAVQEQRIVGVLICRNLMEG